MTQFKNYVEARSYAIRSPFAVCVLIHKREKGLNYVVADNEKEQSELIKQGYRPA